ncbi:MAG: DUF421 domain-containing protein [Bacilli bacterium]|nr:DUF421 domain-containing protein [Bacilli bacterium]
MKYLAVFYRSVFFYILITFLYRLMGKREMGELTIMDFIVSIFIAEMVAISIENYKSDILLSIIPIVTLVVLQIGFSIVSLKSQKARNVVDGEPSVIISRGKINFKEMLKQRYNLDDLLTQLRGQSIKSIEEVDYAILETSGKLSIFKKSDDKKSTYPLALILDGKLNEDVLLQIRKSKIWLRKELEKEKIRLEDVFYGFYKNKKLYIIEKNKIK